MKLVRIRAYYTTGKIQATNPQQKEIGTMTVIAANVLRCGALSAV